MVIVSLAFVCALAPLVVLALAGDDVRERFESLERAVPESLRRFRQFFLRRIGNEGCNRWAGSRNHGAEAAEERTAKDRER